MSSYPPLPFIKCPWAVFGQAVSPRGDLFIYGQSSLVFNNFLCQNSRSADFCGFVDDGVCFGENYVLYYELVWKSEVRGDGCVDDDDSGDRLPFCWRRQVFYQPESRNAVDNFSEDLTGGLAFIPDSTDEASTGAAEGGVGGGSLLGGSLLIVAEHRVFYEAVSSDAEPAPGTVYRVDLVDTSPSRRCALRKGEGVKCVFEYETLLRHPNAYYRRDSIGLNVNDGFRAKTVWYDQRFGEYESAFTGASNYVLSPPPSGTNSGHEPGQVINISADTFKWFAVRGQTLLFMDRSGQMQQLSFPTCKCRERAVVCCDPLVCQV